MSTKNLIEFFVSNLIDQPNLVSVKQIEMDNKLVYEVKIAPNDLSKLIKNEAIFRALKSIASISSNKPTDIVIDIV